MNDIIYNDEIEYLCIYAHGSRVFGNPRKNSDIDFVLFYKGTIREDDLFNIFADENIYIEHIKCDFNPIEIDDKSDIEYYIQKHDVEYHQKPVLEKKINLALALDDFDDEEQVQNIKSKQNNHEDYTKNYLDAMEYFVDLGLPSGTLWCKYNLGVDYKKLVKNPENSIIIPCFFKSLTFPLDENDWHCCLSFMEWLCLRNCLPASYRPNY